MEKRILIAPLDWGLGHATRCIPIINELLSQNAEVVIAADNAPYELLNQEFPQLEFIRLEGYNITYPEEGSMMWQLFLQIPKIARAISREHLALQNIIEKYAIDGVISDNRFGLWSKKVPCVFITHQLHIQAPLLVKSWIRKINFSYINKYISCWIPDDEKTQLSGVLAHQFPKPKNMEYIGTLSRFSDKKEEVAKKYEVLAILSGPEPQRSIFERIVLNQLQESDLTALVVLGKPLVSVKEQKGKTTIVNHLAKSDFQKAIQTSEIIVCRSGYSTLMDLAVFGKKAILVPTSGQTEQEYLAKYHGGKENYYAMTQKTFNLKKGLDSLQKYKEIEKNKNTLFLRKSVEKLLNK